MTQFLFLLAPVLSIVILYESVFTFRLWECGQRNAVIAIGTLTVHINLLYNGWMDSANAAAIIGMLLILARSIRGGGNHGHIG